MADKSKGAKSKRSKDANKSAGSQGPNPILIGVTILVAGATVWFLMNRGGSGDKEGGGEAVGEVVAPALEDGEAFDDLGRTLAIGPAAEAVSEKGTEIVLPADVKGAAEALAGDDVAAFTELLEREKIAHVLVDPSVTVRNPIPKRTVKNRLALAHPAGRLNATLMSKKLFSYRISDGAPALTPEQKKTVMDLVRFEAGADGSTDPGPQKGLLSEEGVWQCILTARKVQGTHLAYFRLDEDTLEKAAREGGRRLAAFWKKAPKETEGKSLTEALNGMLNLEFEVVYDEGVFVGPRDDTFMWRIIEPGIYGFNISEGRKTRQQPPWYSVTGNFRTLEFMFGRECKRLGEPADCWLESDRPIERFRTVHWRERTPGGEIEDLYRASPRIPAPSDITKESLVESLAGLGSWIADKQHYPSHRSIYRYFPTKDEENDEYNGVRHALGPLSMAMTNEFSPDPKYKAAAEDNMRFIEDHIRWGGAPRRSDGTLDETVDTWMGKPLPGDDVAIYEVEENMFDDSKGPDWASKMGGVAVAILGYTQFRLASWELGPEHEKVLEGLGNFLLYMQREDGSFHHYYVAAKNRYYGTRNSIYPGEILYALARLYGETKDDRFKVAFDRSMKENLDWFKREMTQKEPDGTYEEDRRKNLVQFQPWIAMAMEEMHRYNPDPAYVEASNLVSLWVMETYQFDETRAFYPDYLGGYMKVLDELPAMHTFVYTEGTAASYVLARRAGADPDAVHKLRKGALLAARFILQMQTRRGENDYYYPNQDMAQGAVRYCMNHNKQRIDYTYHALSSVYRILHAATPEDYAFIASMELPPAW